MHQVSSASSKLLTGPSVLSNNTVQQHYLNHPLNLGDREDRFQVEELEAFKPDLEIHNNNQDRHQKSDKTRSIGFHGDEENLIDDDQRQKSHIDTQEKLNMSFNAGQVLKEEPESPVASVQAKQQASNCCAKCRKPLREKFILSVNDLHWHQDCVQCADCSLKLTDRCYTIEGNLYCRHDYWRRFGPKCANCMQSIEPSELVQKIKGNRVYHLKCFNCFECGRQLEFGEQLHLIDGKHLLCKQDYQKQLKAPKASDTFASSGDYSSSSPANSLTTLMSPMGQTTPHTIKCIDDVAQFGTNSFPTNQSQQQQSQQQKPYKSSGNANLQEGLKQQQELNSKQHQTAGSENSDDLIDANGKRRGPRTTIKPKQLETLRRAFESAPKPSRHIREQLATETGLNMRVIQVWFQNRRSKERRMRNSNGSARRNFFRSSSRRLRVGGGGANGAANTQQPLQSGGAALQTGGAAQQSLIVAQNGPSKSKGSGNKQRGSPATNASNTSSNIESNDQLLAERPIGLADDSEQSPLVSGAEFGANPTGGSSTPGGSDGEFTYFSDSSNQGDNQTAFGPISNGGGGGATNQSPSSIGAPGKQYNSGSNNQTNGATAQTAQPQTHQDAGGQRPASHYNQQHQALPQMVAAAPQPHGPPPHLQQPQLFHSNPNHNHQAPHFHAQPHPQHPAQPLHHAGPPSHHNHPPHLNHNHHNHHHQPNNHHNHHHHHHSHAHLHPADSSPGSQPPPPPTSVVQW